MFTTTSFRHLIWGALVLGASHAQGQTSVLGNSGIATDFLGWDNIGPNNFPLQVRHDLNQPIDFYTNAIQRMRLNPTQTSLINGFTVPTDGFMGLGQNALTNNAAPIRPWTRLHLHDRITQGNAVEFGFRDWMHNGVTMTGHGDHMYIGHKYGPGFNDPTDAVFQWADNGNETQGPDLMRFIFTSNFAPTALSGANSLFGREIMQLHPQGFIGLGDFSAATVALGSLVSPTERLDVLDGRVRVCDLHSRLYV